MTFSFIQQIVLKHKPVTRNYGRHQGTKETWRLPCLQGAHEGRQIHKQRKWNMIRTSLEVYTEETVDEEAPYSEQEEYWEAFAD